MIDIKKLTPEDRGRWVVYDDGIRPPEKGRIKFWNDLYVFVVYKCNGDWKNFINYTGVATSPDDLTFLEEYSKKGGE